jgi:hypothetical protein
VGEFNDSHSEYLLNIHSDKTALRAERAKFAETIGSAFSETDKWIDLPEEKASLDYMRATFATVDAAGLAMLDAHDVVLSKRQSGTSASEIASAEAVVPVIPLSALLPGRSLPAVLVMHDGVGELRVLRVGERSTSDRVQVLSGLRVGEVVLDHPPASARSGFRLSDLGGEETDSTAEEGV